MTAKWIEHIEGEAVVDFDLDAAGGVDFASIRFPHFRGMERILLQRPALDALIITPRVCGICGHSHLMATVEALEAVYADAGAPVLLSEKSRAIREITLMLELVQNHFKWFYLVIRPELARLAGVSLPKSDALKGAYAAASANKALSVFSGQWPHSSYAVPGGVTCDPTQVDRIRAEGYLDETLRFFEREFAGICLDYFLTLKSCKELNAIESDMTATERMLTGTGMHEMGFSYDRFMVLGAHGYAHPSKVDGTVVRRANAAKVALTDPFAPGGETHAFNAHYKGKYYETGPLARAMANNVTFIKNVHRRFKDSAYTRVNARVFEIGQLLYRVKQRLQELDLSEPSYVEPSLPLKELHGTGQGVVEAPRGPLIHRMEVEGGFITGYEMITPTQWNLGSGVRQAPGVAQQAMIGASCMEEAAFIFRTFDVCSVCTTH
jgi:uptake hydrogenase large subunit